MSSCGGYYDVDAVNLRGRWEKENEKVEKRRNGESGGDWEWGSGLNDRTIPRIVEMGWSEAP